MKLFFFPSNFELTTHKTLILNEIWTLQSRKFMNHNPLKKCVMNSLLIMKLKIVFTIVGHVILLKVMTLKIKKFEIFELFDGFYNFLFCPIKVHNFSKVITYSKRCFS